MPIRLVRIVSVDDPTVSYHFYSKLLGDQGVTLRPDHRPPRCSVDLGTKILPLHFERRDRPLAVRKHERICLAGLPNAQDLFLRALHRGHARIDGLVIDPDGHEVDLFEHRNTLVCVNRARTATFYELLGLTVQRHNDGSPAGIFCGSAWLRLVDGTDQNSALSFQLQNPNPPTHLREMLAEHGFASPGTAHEHRLVDPDGRHISLEPSQAVT